jgi:hypothetical protein
VAFLASGASTDGRHILPNAESFFPEFFHLHDTVPVGRTGQLAKREWGDQVRRLIFDLVGCSCLPYLCLS